MTTLQSPYAGGAGPFGLVAINQAPGGGGLGATLSVVCGPRSCGARPGDTTTFGILQGLQRAINGFLKTDRLKVDGLIGKITLGAFTEVTNQMPVAVAVPTTFEQLAKSADDWGRMISQFAKIPESTAPSGEQRKPGDEDLPPPPPKNGEKVEEKKSQVLWWVLGAVGVVGMGFFGYYLWRRSQGKSLLGEGEAEEESSDDFDGIQI